MVRPGEPGVRRQPGIIHLNDLPALGCGASAPSGML
jgi:hypothetical protein